MDGRDEKPQIKSRKRDSYENWFCYASHEIRFVTFCDVFNFNVYVTQYTEPMMH